MSVWVFAADVVKFFTQLIVSGQAIDGAPALQGDPSPPGRVAAIDRVLRLSWFATVALLVFVIHRRYSDEGLKQATADGVMNVIESAAAQLEDTLRYGPSGKGHPGPHQSFAKDATQLMLNLPTAAAATDPYAELAELARRDAVAAEQEFQQEVVLAEKVPRAASDVVKERAAQVKAIAAELNAHAERLEAAEERARQPEHVIAETWQIAMRAKALSLIARQAAEAAQDSVAARRLAEEGRVCSPTRHGAASPCADRDQQRHLALAIAERLAARASARLQRSKEEAIKNHVRSARFGPDGTGYLFLYSDESAAQHCVAHGVSPSREGMPFGNLADDEKCIITGLREHAGRDEGRGTVQVYLFPRPHPSANEKDWKPAWKAAYSRYLMVTRDDETPSATGRAPERQPYRHWWVGGGLYVASDHPLNPDYALFWGLKTDEWLYALAGSLLLNAAFLARRLLHGLRAVPGAGSLPPPDVPPAPSPAIPGLSGSGA